jgi:hypothetical protein
LAYRRKIKMSIELTSFILGIISVLVIGVSVVSVVAIVKVMKLKEWLINTNVEFERVRKTINDGNAETFRLVDSRCDKLYEKIMKTKNPVLEMADKDGFKSNLLQVLNKEDEGNDLKNRILQLINKIN